MNCQYPHKTPESGPHPPGSAHEVDPKAAKTKKAKRDRLKKLNDLSKVPPAPSGFICPRLGFDESGKLSLVDVPEIHRPPSHAQLEGHFSLPVPLFKPSSPTLDGNVGEDITRPLRDKRMVLKDALKHECMLLMRTNRGLRMPKILSRWEGRMNNEEGGNLGDLESFAWLNLKYGNSKAPSESFVGGNVGTIRLNEETFLIHSPIEALGTGAELTHALCLTRVTPGNEMSDHLMDIGPVKVALDDGRVFQITAARPPFRRVMEDPLFVTRQLYKTRLWQAQLPGLEGDAEQPVVSCLHEEGGSKDGIVRSVDLSGNIRGEYCELRRGEIAVIRNGRHVYRKTLNEEYQQCLYENHHPMQLLLASEAGVSLLDTRSRPVTRIQPLFSLRNKRMGLYFNLPPDEHILTFSIGSHQHTSYTTTETSFLAWDHRFGSRPLLRTAHQLGPPGPRLMTSTIINSLREEWLFFESLSSSPAQGGQGGLMGLSWVAQPYTTSPSSASLALPTVQALPTVRQTISDTLHHVQLTKGLGLDWHARNRLLQPVTGLTCEITDRNGVIQIWSCTAAGDIFTQLFDVNDKVELSEDHVASRMSQWFDALDQVESEPNSRCKLMATEINQCLYIGQKVAHSSIKGEEVYSKDATLPDDLVQKTSFLQQAGDVFDRRGRQYLRAWGREPVAAEEEARIPAASASSTSLPDWMDLPVDKGNTSGMHRSRNSDSDDDELITSTPLEHCTPAPKSQSQRLLPPHLLLPYTPLVPQVGSASRASSIPAHLLKFSSTPLHVNTMKNLRGMTDN